MNDRFLNYLERERDRLEAAIHDLRSSRFPDDAAIARLKKQKLAVKDQIAQWERCSVAA
jgi:hypothetical protein